MSNNVNECTDAAANKAIADPAVRDVIDEEIELNTEMEAEVKMEALCLQQRRKASWPLVCAGIASVGWIIPLIGIPFSIAAIVGGYRAHRKWVLTVGAISLGLSCINFGVGFMLGLGMD